MDKNKFYLSCFIEMNKKMPKNRSLLEVNEDFQDKRNAAMRFLVISYIFSSG